MKIIPMTIALTKNEYDTLSNAFRVLYQFNTMDVDEKDQTICDIINDASYAADIIDSLLSNNLIKIEGD